MDSLEYWYPNCIDIKSRFDKVIQQINLISKWDDQEGAKPFFFHLRRTNKKIITCED
jgi:hypothetical protein